MSRNAALYRTLTIGQETKALARPFLCAKQSSQRIDLFKVGFSFCFDAPVPIFGTGVFVFGPPLKRFLFDLTLEQALDEVQKNSIFMP
ncbi:MAG: hypothetical protein IAE84_04345 [Saprospiraceae bacterium]|jgi:hypothetical protein|nr:hypothetical protein [Saprospiraceae bacterium]HRD80136.1 hypothetical protein [Saprospiraceae bacterium]HRF40547.1 hypothetical protein [Saprospiraceae bacterium]HRK83753.1 hypothetical protein [Saprospiraceae bacterium]